MPISKWTKVATKKAAKAAAAAAAVAAAVIQQHENKFETATLCTLFVVHTYLKKNI